MQLGQAVAEDTGGGNQDHHNGQGADAGVQSLPHALPVQALIDEHGDDQGVDNGDGGGLGGSEHTAHDTHNHDEDGSQCPEGGQQLLDKDLQVEGLALGVIALDGDDVGANHQGDSQDAGGQIACQEQGAHGNAAGSGGIDDHVMAGRHQQTLAGGGDGDGGGEVGVIALVHHHGDQQRAQGCGIGGGGAGDAAEEIGSHDVDHGQAAAHPADAGIGQGDELLGDTAGAHENAHGDEEGNSHQGEGADALHQQTGKGNQGVALRQQAEHRGKANGVSDGEAQQNHRREAAQQNQSRKGLGIHYACTSFSSLRKNFLMLL